MTVLSMTDSEIAKAVTDVLKHFGEMVILAQGTQKDKRKTIGAITVQFHDDGQYSYAFGGAFQRGTALGALLDATLTLREAMAAQETGEQMAAFIESLSLQPKDVN